MDKSQKGALFVFLTLLASVVAGLALTFAYSGRPEDAVPLLVACVLVAFGLILATFRVVTRLRLGRLNAERYGMPPGRLLHLLSRQQWLILMIGLTVAAVGTGALTGVRILAATPAQRPPAAATRPAPLAAPTAAETTAPPAIAAAPADLAATPSASDTTATASSPSANEIPTPAPGSTTYLDSVNELAGDYGSKAVTFSSVRYPRGISFYCRTATNSFLQWNVAGSSRFEATAGIDDETGGAFGKVVELLFYDQDGRQLTDRVEVSVGHPKKITFPLTAVVSLRMTCATRFVKTNEQTSTYAAMGDPIIVHG